MQTYTASDPESDSLTWSLAGDDAGDFTISAAGALTFNAAPDFEIPADGDPENGDNPDNIYKVTVQVSDGKDAAGAADAAADATLAVTVTVTDANDPPVATDDSATMDEDSGEADINVLANDVDQDRDDLHIAGFSKPGNGSVRSYTVAKTINRNGEIKEINVPILIYKPRPNFHGTDSFTYTVSDGRYGKGTATVTVAVNPVNDPPAFTEGLAAVSYAENGTGTVQTYTASDPESDAVTWSLAGDDANHFTLSNAGVLTFNAAPDFENPADGDSENGDDPDNVYKVTVQVSDGKDATGADDAAVDATLAVTVTVTNVNEGPTANDDSIIAAEGTAVEIAVTANDTDPDAGASLQIRDYVGPGNGRVTVKNTETVFIYTSNPDFNGEDSFSYTVSDGSLTDTATVTVTVNPFNDPPVFTEGLADVRYAENGTGPVQTYTASDPESDSLTWSLDGRDASHFTLSNAGVLSFNAAPDFENPADGVADLGDAPDNVYKVEVGLSDGKDAAGEDETTLDLEWDTTLAVTVTVTNVNEEPTASDDIPRPSMRTRRWKSPRRTPPPTRTPMASSTSSLTTFPATVASPGKRAATRRSSSILPRPTGMARRLSLTPSPTAPLATRPR